jgi:hypothetical protein
MAGLGSQWSGGSQAQRELKLTCIGNLLSTSEERIYFKDLQSSVPQFDSGRRLPAQRHFFRSSQFQNPVWIPSDSYGCR